MKRKIKLTEQELVKLIERIISEQSGMFKAEAIVEDDMLIKFSVVEFKYVDGDVEMILKNPLRSNSTDLLSVWNFKGPIYDSKTNQKVYRDSSFSNINKNNYKEISRRYNIPLKMT
jgi:hypothetical protein